MRFHRFLPSLSLAAVMLAAACIDAPTASQARGGSATVAASTSVSDELANQAKKARHDSLMALRDSVRRAAKEQKDQLKGQLAIQKAAWQAFQRDWKTQLKLDKFATLDLLRCEPLEYSSDAEVIGPKGGTLHVGPHTLEVPAGALNEEQLIVGTAPMGELVRVDFGPHGLNVLRSADLKLSYEHCLAPTNLLFRVVYVDDALRILERPASSDRKGLQEVVGRIDHFSSYMIAY